MNLKVDLQNFYGIFPKNNFTIFFFPNNILPTHISYSPFGPYFSAFLASRDSGFGCFPNHFLFGLGKYFSIWALFNGRIPAFINIAAGPPETSWKDVSRIVHELCQKYGTKNYITIKEIESLGMNLPFKDMALINIVHGQYIARLKLL